MLTKNEIDKIESYYNISIEKCPNGRPKIRVNIVSKNSNNESIHVNPMAEKIFFKFGLNPSEEEIVSLIENGGIILSSGKEIYKIFAGLTEEEILKANYNYDIRTQNYFNTCREDIGFIKLVKSYEKFKYDLIDKFPQDGYIEDVEIGKLDNGTYILTYGYGFDDYYVDTYIFNKEPNENSFKTINLIQETEYLLWEKGTIINCRECGRKETHWLDVEGSLLEKVTHLEDQCCCS